MPGEHRDVRMARRNEEHPVTKNPDQMRDAEEPSDTRQEAGNTLYIRSGRAAPGVTAALRWRDRCYWHDEGGRRCAVYSAFGLALRNTFGPPSLIALGSTRTDVRVSRRYRAKRRPVYGPVLFGDAPHPSLSLRAALRAFYDAKRRRQGVLWSVRRELCNDCAT